MPEEDVQAVICERLDGLGWEVTLRDSELPRLKDKVVRESDLRPALLRLNPEVAEQPDRATEIVGRLRPALTSAHSVGLLAANEAFGEWLRGIKTMQFVGADAFSQVRLIDFDNPRANSLRATTEVTFRAGREQRRYDIVLWVNGLPLVVGETKRPGPSTSWLNAAKDIHNGYEQRTPSFFVPNVLSFATDGRDFRYGAVCQPPEQWLKWANTTDELAQPGLASVLRAVELLLTPETVLEILRHFTLYSSRPTAEGAKRQKIIPRYPQIEAVNAIVDRCLDDAKSKGLVWHHQGSGKTFAMAYAAAKLRHIRALDAPTIVVVLDRLELIQQTVAEFESVGIQAVEVAETRETLRRTLSSDARGVVITTIYRFKDAGKLNARRNIVVMVDEAHRTQEGRLGLDMREALPNAKYIGLTGTPISTDDRNTWETFGDTDDPGGVLNHYSVERSIFDGATLPVHVETRLVDFHFDAAALEEGFAQLVAEEGLDDDEREYLTRRASHISVVVRDADRVAAVCEDIVKHYREKIAPLGLKAQIVVYDRAACVAYYEQISQMLNEGEEATVVMTTAKDDPSEWSQWDLSRDDEARIKNRFRDVADPLKFVIVTAKLLTGFDAPIEGVMYLDKPLRAHTLFQAVCRTNRRWTNPYTGQEKQFGLVVDYVGIGEELIEAVSVRAEPSAAGPPQADLDALLEEMIAGIERAWQPFANINADAPPAERLLEAQTILATEDDRAEFAAEFSRCQGLLEFLYPDQRLKPYEERYRFLARLYHSVQPSKAANQLLWQRLGAKTRALIHDHLQDVTVTDGQLDRVKFDAEALDRFKQQRLLFDHEVDAPRPPSANDVLNRLEERIRRRMEGTDPHRHWRSLSERLEELRAARLADAEASVRFLQQILDLASDLVRAERADDEDELDEIQVLDPRTAALTQIFAEYAPPDPPKVVERVVQEVDDLVYPMRGSGWQRMISQDKDIRRRLRLILKSHGLPFTGDLFTKAYNYIRENY